eukprot:142057-Karenia_brevis.AAC.1
MKLGDRFVKAKPDQPVEERVVDSFLLGLKYHLVKWGFSKAVVKADLDEKFLQVDRMVVVKAAVEEQ